MKKAIYLILTISITFGLLNCEGKNKKYEEAVVRISSTLPMTFPEGITMDKIEYANGEFKYYYTFAEQPVIPSDQFMEISKPELIKSLKDKPEMKMFRDDKITIYFIYRTSDGKNYAEVKIMPEDFK